MPSLILSPLSPGALSLARTAANAMVYGARGDGVTDDTAALQAAINSGLPCYIPPGTYKYTTLTAPTDGYIFGAGNRQTILQQIAGTASPLFSARSASRVVLESLLLTGSVNTSSNTGGVLFTGCARPVCRGVEVTFVNNYAFSAAGLAVAGDSQAPLFYQCVVGTLNTSGTAAFLMQSGGNSSPDRHRILFCRVSSAVGIGYKIDKTGDSRGFGADGMFAFNDLQEVPTIWSIDGSDVQVFGNNFEVSSGTMASSVASTAFRVRRMLNTYATAGTRANQTFTDNSPAGTNRTRVAFEDYGTGVEFVAEHAVPLTYAATMTPNTENGTYFTIAVTDTSAFTIANPTNTNSTTGKRICFEITNSSGGVLGTVSWGAAYKVSFVKPASGKTTTIAFVYNGTNWVQDRAQSPDL